MRLHHHILFIVALIKIKGQKYSMTIGWMKYRWIHRTKCVSSIWIAKLITKKAKVAFADKLPKRCTQYKKKQEEKTRALRTM